MRYAILPHVVDSRFSVVVAFLILYVIIRVFEV